VEFNNDVIVFTKLLSACIFGNGKIDENENINWDFVFSCAVRNDVLPLLLPAFRLNGGVKTENLAVVEKRAGIDAYKETKKEACAAKFLNALAAEGIKAVVLKGLAYKAFYPYPELRKMSDLDLLIPDGDLQKVYEIAKNAGGVTNDREVHHFTIDSVLNVETSANLYPDRENSLSEEYLINEEVTPDTAHKFAFYDDEFYTLSPTHNILYCAYHMFKHFVYGGVGARQMCDFALLISKLRNEIDFEYVFAQCKHAKMTKFFCTLLRISDRFFGVDLSEIYADLSEKVDDKTVDEVWCDMLDGGVFGVSAHEREIARSIVFRKIKEKNGNSSYSGLRAVFPPLSYMRREFSYVDSVPVLLPVGWIHRLVKFLFKRLFKRGEFKIISKAQKSAEKRLEIMDKLDIY